jgi:hypothetical protein
MFETLNISKLKSKNFFILYFDFCKNTFDNWNNANATKPFFFKLP